MDRDSLNRGIYLDQKRNMKHVLHRPCEGGWIDDEFEVIDRAAIGCFVPFDETPFDMHDLLDRLFAQFRIEFFDLQNSVCGCVSSHAAIELPLLDGFVIFRVLLVFASVVELV
jgi:hypothetical protein